MSHLFNYSRAGFSDDRRHIWSGLSRKTSRENQAELRYRCTSKLTDASSDAISSIRIVHRAPLSFMDGFALGYSAYKGLFDQGLCSW